MSQAKSFRSLLALPPTTASPHDSSLLIIDAQNEYATGALKTANISSTRSAISSLLSLYRSSSSQQHIIHITHKTPDGAPVFTPGTQLAEEFEELSPEEGEVKVVKSVPGAFTGTELGEVLEKGGRKKVVLVGYMAHVCVSTTARQAAERGYEVVVVREAVGDRDIPGAEAKEVVEGTLRELGDAFGTVVGVGDIK
ncbi:hypothetical protein MMC10_006278 [Thelotrema lepadinum]|nr:hypothetical protein [Thelotrema lepadinum]